MAGRQVDKCAGLGRQADKQQANI